MRLAREEAEQLAQHAELLAMSHDLVRKLTAEKAEIARLKEEIQEVQTLYGYRSLILRKLIYRIGDFCNTTPIPGSSG